MPIRAIVIMFVAAVVIAVCYRDQIYKWVTENIGKGRREERKDEKSEEEKENQD